MTPNKKYEGRIMPHEEHYHEEYWDMIRALQEVFARTNRPNARDQLVYEACRQRMGPEKIIRLAQESRLSASPTRKRGYVGNRSGSRTSVRPA